MAEYINRAEILWRMTNSLDEQDTYLPIHFKELVLDEVPTADVVERSKIDKAITEIEKLANRNPSYWATCDVVDREDVLEILRNIGE